MRSARAPMAQRRLLEHDRARQNDVGAGAIHARQCPASFEVEQGELRCPRDVSASVGISCP
jgi:hypothetical protein